MTFDALIAQGIRDTLEEKCAERRVYGKTHRFSLAYKIGRRNIVRSRINSTPLSLRKIRVILIAVILTIFALTGFGIWQQLGGFSFSLFNDHSKVSYSADNFKTTIEEIYGLPEEYELLNISLNDFNVVASYKVNDETVTLFQQIGSLSYDVNTENFVAEYLTINGNDGYYIKNIVGGDNYVAWITDGYQFSIFGKIDKNTAVSLAKSLKIRDFDKIS
ncbi:MAG: DUF4367 domain-containing protein [Oscillospiraceae bacterium]|nr:DUF4367 domain-containing protein [Oscillospiraceae bacterium]